MAKLMDLTAETGANIIDDDSSPVLTLTNSSTGRALVVERSSTSGPTIAPLVATMSIASGAVLGIRGVFISTASMNLAASQTAFVIPVYHETQGVLGYINVSKGVV